MLYSLGAKDAVRVNVASNDGNGGASCEIPREEVERYTRAGMEFLYVFDEFWSSSSYGLWLRGKPVFSPLVTGELTSTDFDSRTHART